MLKIRSITMKNFLSVGQITQAIDLTADGLTLVLGNNLDTAMQGENASRNGAGKSTLMNGISYGLFGKALTRIKADNLINKTNQRGMAVTLEFEKDGKLHRIERGRKPTYFRYFVDNQQVGEDQEVTDESQGEGKHTQEVIETVLGLTHPMFAHIVALNTSTEPFLKMTGPKQREVIEELLGLTALSEKADALKEQLNGSTAKGVVGTKGHIRDEEFRLKTLTEANDRIQKAIDDAKLKQRIWNDRRDAKLADLKETLDGLGGIDFDAELAAFDAVEAYHKKAAELADFAASVDLQHEKFLTEYQGKLKDAEALDREAALIRREKKDAVREADLIRREKKDAGREVEYLLRGKKKGDQEVALILASRKNAEHEIALLLAGRKDPEQEALAVLRGVRDTDDTAQRRRIDQDIARYRDEVAAATEEINRLTAERDRLTAALGTPDQLTCSTCGQSLKDGSDHRDHMLGNLTAERDRVDAALARWTRDRVEREGAIAEREAERDALAVRKAEAEAHNAALETQAEAAMRAAGEHNAALEAKAQAKADEVAAFNAEIEAQARAAAEAVEAFNAEINAQAAAKIAEIEADNAAVEAQADAKIREIEAFNQDLEAAARNKAEAAEAIRDAAETMRTETEPVIDEARRQIDEERAALGACPETLFPSRDDLWSARSIYDQTKRDYDAERAAVNPYDEQVAGWEAQIVAVDYTAMNTLVRLKEHQEFLLKLLTDKGSFIRKSLIDQNLSYLNTRLSHHLGRIGLPHEVKFQNDLSVEITQFGRDLDFDNLSRGEQNRLMLSLSWAFRDIFENLKHPINLLMVDEMVDSGMDALGVELAFEALKGMVRERGKNVFLISHRDELITRSQSILTARKENGFTVYELDGVA